MAYALDLLVRSTLLLSLAWIAAAVARRAGASAAMRHLIWLFAMVALLALPLLGALLPPLELAILPETAPLARTGAAGESAAGSPLYMLAVWLYLAVAAGFAARLVLGRFALAAMWRRARPARQWAGLLGALRAGFPVRRRVDLRVAAGRVMPMTWGALRPRILLPADALGWSEERRRHVLVHELAHVARFDSSARLGASLACALYWFHPAIWHASRRMRIEQEHAADDLVLASGAGPRSYALDLLDIAGSLSAARPSAGLAPAMGETGEIERRLFAIIGNSSRQRAGTAFAGGLAVAALLSTWLLATAVPVAAAHDPPASTSPKAYAVGRIELPTPHSGARLGARRHAVRVEPGPRSEAAQAKANRHSRRQEPIRQIGPLHSPPAIPAVPAVPAIPSVPVVPALPVQPAAPP